MAPSSTEAVLSTAPTPVWIAQPITQATSSGTSFGIGMAPVSGVSTCSAKAATPRPRMTRSPLRERPVLPSGRVLAARLVPTFTQQPGSPRTQK